ncbi:MAG: Uncharacterized protein G01um10143_420 [Parcubacteria group bacterium Gr01-1014_3]|nr:MAG: Uncharacterized protein G01um10143_420 [Parcubacteria group bacterium Gr01-1014_3]
MINKILAIKKSTILIAALLVVLTGTTYYFYSQYQRFRPNKSARQESADLIAAVGRLIVLPVGEEPTIATVSNPDRLRDQVFFANAQAGDKVLIYAIAQKAILYDPDEDKIVEVAPLSIGSANNAPSKKK